jgi:hypothetical protein
MKNRALSVHVFTNKTPILVGASLFGNGSLTITTLYYVRIQSVAADTLVCRLTDALGRDNPFPPSRTMALWLIWEPWHALDRGWFFSGDFGGLSAEQAQELAKAAPFGQEVRDRDYCDEDWNRANGGRFIRCVGVRDHYSGSDRQFEDDAPREERPQATYTITATAPRWFEHLRVGMDWETTAYDCDERLAVDPSWLTPAVLAIARAIADEGAYDQIPILADALQEAGCQDQALLNHCRAPGRHALGCWLIDLLLESGAKKGSELDLR